MTDNGHYVKMRFFANHADMSPNLDTRNKEVEPDCWTELR